MIKYFQYSKPVPVTISQLPQEFLSQPGRSSFIAISKSKPYPNRSNNIVTKEKAVIYYKAYKWLKEEEC